MTFWSLAVRREGVIFLYQDQQFHCLIMGSAISNGVFYSTKQLFFRWFIPFTFGSLWLKNYAAFVTYFFRNSAHFTYAKPILRD